MWCSFHKHLLPTKTETKPSLAFHKENALPAAAAAQVDTAATATIALTAPSVLIVQRRLATENIGVGPQRFKDERYA